MANHSRPIMLFCLVAGSSTPFYSSAASETVNYSYDAAGRLVKVDRSGAVGKGVSVSYSFDKADNRTNVTVAVGWTSVSWRTGDFNGDGRDDVLWRHDNGTVTDWLGTATGGFQDNWGNASTPVGTDWKVEHTGDFNGDGRSDILWRRNDGQISNWLGTSNGGFADNAANAMTASGTDWFVAGTGDFNGDGRDDVLWRHHGDGVISNWLGNANGGYTGNGANSTGAVALDWHVVGIADFNGDGRDDILWRHDSGQLSNWLGQPNGGYAHNSANAGQFVDPQWKVAGTGDFNGDGRGDILWRHDAGLLTDWLGTTSGGYLQNWNNASYQMDIIWRAVATGDFNGDGRDDILWRSSAGTISNWLGTSVGGFTNNDPNALGEVSTDWHVERR